MAEETRIYDKVVADLGDPKRLVRPKWSIESAKKQIDRNNNKRRRKTAVA